MMLVAPSSMPAKQSLFELRRRVDVDLALEGDDGGA